MPAPNPFRRIAERYADMPAALRRPLVTNAVGATIPFVDTAGCFVDAYTPHRVAVRLDNEARLRNHLGGLHAAALALLAETATGLVVALNVPDGSSPLLRSIDVSFDEFARDAVQADATLSDEEGAQIRARPLGQIEVAVRLTAPNADAPLVSGTLTWAWLPEDRLSGDS
jgi:acyl-coenzyme A thioesterase PaaI-like protein